MGPGVELVACRQAGAGEMDSVHTWMHKLS